jgi:hypothetical protein
LVGPVSLLVWGLALWLAHGLATGPAGPGARVSSTARDGPCSPPHRPARRLSDRQTSPEGVRSGKRVWRHSRQRRLPKHRHGRALSRARRARSRPIRATAHPRSGPASAFGALAPACGGHRPLAQVRRHGRPGDSECGQVAGNARARDGPRLSVIKII